MDANGPAAGVVPFTDLGSADLYVDRIYQGGSAGNVSDDPLQRLLPVGNQGGFRYKGSPARGGVRLVVLYTTGADPEWPDTLGPSQARSPTLVTLASAPVRGR